jgi:hypothetical protein
VASATESLPTGREKDHAAALTISLEGATAEPVRADCVESVHEGEHGRRRHQAFPALGLGARDQTPRPRGWPDYPRRLWDPHHVREPIREGLDAFTKSPLGFRDAVVCGAWALAGQAALPS